MESSTSINVGNTPSVAHSHNPPSTLKTYGIALAIISVVIGGLALCGVGLAGYLQVGALSNMSQIGAISMMAAGATLLVIGIISSVKTFSKAKNQPANQSSVSYQEISPSPKSVELKTPQVNLPNFSAVNSSSLITGDPQITNRQDFLNSKNWVTPPPVISKSEFVSLAMAKHLMRNKKDSALGVKYVQGDEITNMEGALHTFITPICLVHMTGDYAWKSGHSATLFEHGGKRQVIISAAIQPDFELDSVMMELVSVRDKAYTGADMAETNIPSAKEKENNSTRSEYDEKLKRHMIYHLTQNHCLPAKETVSSMTEQDATQFIEGEILNHDFDLSVLQNKFVSIKGKIISLEMFFNTYFHQLRNEFRALEHLLPQGYVYTIDPPGIFVKALGGAMISNRLQILALKYLQDLRIFKNLQVVAFNDYSDKKGVGLLDQVFNKKIKVLSKSALFSGNGGTYSVQGKYALVLHNNSDAFGQNIESEKMTSMDGVIGSCSDAACVLQRDRADLMNYIFA